MTTRRESLQSSRGARDSHDAGDSHEWRDQGESAFSAILELLLSRLPGARAAALVDREGETVDYAAAGDPFRVRVTAAHWRIVLEDGAVQRSLEGLRWLAVRCGRRSYLVHALPHGYALVVAFVRGAALLGWDRTIASIETCVRALSEEAGWVRVEEDGVGAGPGKRRRDRIEQRGVVRWFPVEVITDEHDRPRSIRVAGRLRPVEILGIIVRHRDRIDRIEKPEPHGAARDIGRGERAWRVRLEKGVEATIVRRPDGTWYADEPVYSLMQPL